MSNCIFTFSAYKFDFVFSFSLKTKSWISIFEFGKLESQSKTNPGPMDVLHAVFIKDLIGRDNYRGLMIINDAL